MKAMRYLIPIGSAIILAFLLVIYFVGFLYENKRELGLIIADDVAELVSIFERIHKDCTIISFDYQKNPINFLTVAKFTGSEVGSMNLGKSGNWKGPYVEDNPEVQGKVYQIVETHQGYFITPGEGVKLPSGKIIGKDVILDEKADIFAMMGNENVFLFREKALAAPLVLGQQKVRLPARLEP